MANSYALLAILEAGPAHGYTLKQRYDETFTRSKPVAFGQVYASLARFERHGWAEVVEIEAGEGPDRKRYRITSDGVAVVESWVYDAEPSGSFADHQLVAKVSVALLSGRTAQTVLANQRNAHLEHMRRLTAERRTASEPVRLLGLSYQLAHLDADLRWIAEAGERVNHLTTSTEGAS